MRTVFALIAAATVTVVAQGQGLMVPAGLERQTWMVDGTTRTALVSNPKPSTSGPVPLVFVFHGHGGTSANAARTFRTHAFWPEAIVIYPQGLPTVGQVTDPEGKLPGWQHVPGGEKDRDLKFVDVLLAWAKEKYRVDSARLFVAGHSNGGSMTYVLWAARGDRFAAFAPSSSVFRPDVIKSARPKPAFVVAGHQDPLVPFAAQRRSLDGLLALNQAPREGEPWSGGARRHTSRIGADVVAYIHSGGHQMPPDAGELMVKFFKEIAARK
jgi:polyhydroxybutyrate depolymerase